MSSRYAPLPTNPRNDDQSEMDAAFGDSDDEYQADEVRPLNGSNLLDTHSSPTNLIQPSTSGGYDFETADYDFPPPGSPPTPSDRALPNDFGNSNGLVPSFNRDTFAAVQRRSWFKQTVASILPSHYVQRFGLGPQVPAGAIGGGLANDGVFANVTAKPTRPIQVVEGDDTYLVPEDARQDAPPTYASAQADAVPPYWETTVHAPFSPDSPGQIVLDGLPTGTVFAFLWNMLVTITFQFIGFLLTYLLHTTHAAQCGSRAGLGILLIHYGFALRGKGSESPNDRYRTDAGGWTTTVTSSGDMYNSTNSATVTANAEDGDMMFGDATRQWLSFFLMTLGWFTLLTSFLSFWRVKRWERGILASQRQDPSGASSNTFNLDTFGFRHALLFRQGLGLNMPWDTPEPQRDDAVAQEDGDTVPLVSPDQYTPEQLRRFATAYASEMQLRENLRASGLI